MSTIKDAALHGENTGIPLKEFGLKGRGVVYVDQATLIQLIDRNSRVLRKDAERFLDILSTVQSVTGRDLAGHLLIRRAPVCSKARTWLEAQGVTVEVVSI